MKVAIIGSTGYGSLELIRILQSHPHFTIGTLLTSSKGDQSVGEAFPHLSHITYSFSSIEMGQELEEELIFFATPAGVSKNWAPAFLEQGKRVVDLSGDFRLQPDQYRQWYGMEPAPKKWLDKAVYGLSEWHAEKIASAQLVANPGCYATAILLALLPLVKASLLTTSSIVIDAKSGITGAGGQLKKELLFSEINENVRPYKLGLHQHIPEIQQMLGENWNLHLVPHLIPMSRGILATIYLPVHNYTISDWQQAYEEAYRDKPFIRLVSGSLPETKQVRGSNFCDIAFQTSPASGYVTLLSVIDNMMKGAAGQAIQNANLMFGLPEETGLHFSPMVP